MSGYDDELARRQDHAERDHDSPSAPTAEPAGSAERNASALQAAVMRRASDEDHASVDDELAEGSLEVADESAGQPLPESVRAPIERSFGEDLGEVRVHTDDRAAEASAGLGADAFTRGKDMYFAAGQYAPGTAEGQHLIAHEAAHVVQGRGGGGKPGVSAPGERAELEADQAAEAAARGAPVKLSEDAEGVMRRPRRDKPDDDWQVTRTDPQGFSPLIHTEPQRDEVPVKLGGMHEQRYSISNQVPAGITFSWKHSITGGSVVHGTNAETGNQVTARYMVSRPGTAVATTTLTQHGPKKKVAKKEGPEIALKVAKPKASVHKLHAQNKDRGETPIADTMQLDEELVAEVHLSELDDDVHHAVSSYAGNMKVLKTDGIGGGRFRVVLKPEKVGKASGELKVMPAQAHADEVVGDDLSVRVEKKGKDEHDYGTRPKDTADALNRLERAWAQVYRDRNTAVNTMLGQEKEQDPPPAQPLWKRFLIGAAKMALNAATAGIGASFASAVVEEGYEGVKEFVKVMAEESLNTIVDQVGSGGELDKPDSDAKGEYGGIKLSLANKFHKIQHLALSDAETTQVDAHMTHATSMAQKLDANDPGTGYSAIVALERGVKAVAGDNAHDQQYRASFQGWCSLLAKNSLGATPVGAIADKDDPDQVAAAEAKAGTDLSKIVNADDITTNPEYYDDRYVAKGLTKTPGVLRLELHYSKSDNRGKGNRALEVKSARIEGLKNDALMETVMQTPIKDLKMPVVARFNDNDDAGFVIGRNEADPPQYWASQDNSTTLAKRYPEGSIEDAARRILDGEFGWRKVYDVKRG